MHLVLAGGKVSGCCRVNGLPAFGCSAASCVLNDCQQSQCMLPGLLRANWLCAVASCRVWLLAESVQLLQVPSQCMLPGLLPASGLCAVGSCPDWLLVRSCGGGDGLRKHFESIIWSAVAAGEGTCTQYMAVSTSFEQEQQTPPPAKSYASRPAEAKAHLQGQKSATGSVVCRAHLPTTAYVTTCKIITIQQLS